MSISLDQANVTSSRSMDTSSGPGATLPSGREVDPAAGRDHDLVELSDG
jgi:hypothetical protein